jgi:hypothetical protein
MPELTFDFVWYKDPKGYRLIPVKPLKLRKGQSMLDVDPDDIQPARIVRNGDRLEPYQPLKIPNLFRKFIDMSRSDEALLKFVETYGPLTHNGLRGNGEIVLDIIDQAENMFEVLRGRTVPLIPLNKLNASIVTDSNRELRLKVSPGCLLDALWLQLAQAQSGPNKVKLRFCTQCDKPLEAGKRADAKFCSDKCRVNFSRSQAQ